MVALDFVAADFSDFNTVSSAWLKFSTPKKNYNKRRNKRTTVCAMFHVLVI